MERDGVLLLVIDIQVLYKKLFYYGEIVVVYIWVENYDGLCVVYGYEIFNLNEEFVLIGILLYVCVKKENFKFILICCNYLEWYKVYEEVKKQG